MFWYGNGMNGWGYALMTIGTVLFWALIIAGVVALFRYVGRGTQQPAPPPWNTHRSTPEQLLAERFANGEIDEAEYQRKLDTLSEKSKQQSRP